jgi:hemolysin III
MRGWLHEKTIAVAVPAAIALVLAAHGLTARLTAVVYGLGLCALFAVSGNYHRRGWSEAARQRMQRLDHATIFVMIAATYTPFCVLALSGFTGWGLLASVWTGALGGFVLALTGVSRVRWVGALFYVMLGWAALAVLPTLVHHLTHTEVAFVLAGGLLYTIGAVVFATRWPDPAPRTFGFHEVWHVFVVAAAVCHFLAVWSLVTS